MNIKDVNGKNNVEQMSSFQAQDLTQNALEKTNCEGLVKLQVQMKAKYVHLKYSE